MRFCWPVTAPAHHSCQAASELLQPQGQQRKRLLVSAQHLLEKCGELLQQQQQQQ